MTISTTASSTTVVLIAAQTVVPFSFIADAASDITVQTTNTSTGASTTLAASQYTVTLNSPTTGQLWGVGGYVTLNSAPGVGYTCTITRTLPLQQLISIQNQGDFAPQVTEQALDTLCMEIQQVSARGGAFRGSWATGNIYNFGDIVQDGANGSNTNNIYVCSNANVSGVWATDLAAGDWALALNVQTIVPNSGAISSQHIVASGASYVSAISSVFIGWQSATTSNKSLTIPQSTGNLSQIVISDLQGTAYTYPITVTPSTGSIIGVNEIYTNYGSLTLFDTTAGWVSI